MDEKENCALVSVGGGRDTRLANRKEPGTKEPAQKTQGAHSSGKQDYWHREARVADRGWRVSYPLMVCLAQPSKFHNPGGISLN
jgi:hypothetical protein